MDYAVHGILQARILAWVAFPFSRGSSEPRSPTLQANSLPAVPQGKRIEQYVPHKTKELSRSPRLLALQMREQDRQYMPTVVKR